MLTAQVDKEERTDGRTDGGRDGWTDERTDGQRDGRMEGRAGGMAGGRTDGRTDIIACEFASFLSCCFLRPYTYVGSSLSLLL